jgi:cytochrome c-type biogenesis protein CcmH
MSAAIRALLAALLLSLAAAGPALAVLPGEMLSDPVLEARARALSEQLRCMVCQNQSIDDSDADLAHDLRVLVRDRIKAGDDDEHVIAYIVSRYGEFVLLKPRFNLRNALLWTAPVLMLAAGGAFMVLGARRKRAATPALSPDEKQALEAILRD